MISTKDKTEALLTHPILRYIHTLLERWKGKEARLLNLTTNHRKIELKISEDRYQNDIPYLLISMREPIKMNGAFDWDHVDIEIQFDGDLYKVIDTINQFDLICENISVTEYK